MKRFATCLATLTLLCGASLASAEKVARFTTSVGVVDFTLRETESPLNVQNFLNYLEAGDYDNTVIHRAPSGFVVQGGSFTSPTLAVPVPAPGSSGGWGSVATRGTVNGSGGTVVSEAATNGLSNVTGTIAFGLTGAGPDSGTSGWFFNLTDNSVAPALLDAQGFTVFGTVTDPAGLAVLNAIANGSKVDKQADWGSFVFAEIPVLGNGDSVFLQSAEILPDLGGVVNAPEPGAIFLACFGLVAFLAYGWRNRRSV